ncbi:MAG: hypothetical protein PHW12_02050 [Smithella sp.]|jgi:hypothetical protein|nr:hypothetical protein [Smithella sp.]
MGKEIGKTTNKEFKIPVELLKAFKNDVRTIPHILPINGWIVFDRGMLISILRGEDKTARINLAKQLEKLGEQGGELIVMQQSTR